MLSVVDCKWDDWQIGDCNQSCGGGIRTNTRVKKVDEQHGGVECTGDSSVTESCNIQTCPGKFIVNMKNDNRIKFLIRFMSLLQKCVHKFLFYLVDCKWTDWERGECSTTCGGGIQIANRKKIQDELFDGKPCDGESTRKTKCNINACPGIEMV